MSTGIPFPAELTQSFEGPDWLSSRRESSLGALADATLPTTSEEVWRYSRIGDLDLDRFTPLAGTGQAPAGLPKGLRDLAEALPDHAGGLVVCNGRLLRRHLDESLASKGVFVGLLQDHPDAEEIISGLAAPVDVFGDLNRAYGLSPMLIDVPAGVTVDRPLVLLQWLETEAVAAFPELVVRLGSDAQATVLDSEASSDGLLALSVPEVHLQVADAARLDYLNLQRLGDCVWRLAGHSVDIGKAATLNAGQIALGGDYARTRTDCRLSGHGAAGNLYAGYFGERTQMLDFRTFQEHRARDTNSDLLFKGAVAGESKSVYTGLIRVHPEAAGTNAFQTNRNIKLGDHAWAESVPNLEIENNDVRCSHASTVGPVDDEQLFYLESRGVPRKVAERLIVSGFFQEILKKLPVPEIAGTIRDELGERLRRS